MVADFIRPQRRMKKEREDAYLVEKETSTLLDMFPGKTNSQDKGTKPQSL